MSDNFHFDIASEGRELFDKAMEIAFSHWNGTEFYRVKDNTLVFFWITKEPPSDAKDAVRLPFKADWKAAADFAWNWLQGSADFGREPDHDGSNGKGWRVFNEAWTHVMGSHYGIVGIQPNWQMYGK